MINLGRKEQCLILIVVVVVLITAGYHFAGPEQAPVELVDPAGEETTQEGSGPVMVHVDGAVEKPGLYKLPPNSRVNDALEQAGTLPDADLSALNLAELLKDERKLVVPRKNLQPAPVSTPAAGTVQSTVSTGALPSNKTAAVPQPNGLVNINTAGAAELDSLPGIGPALAQRIIQHREANGPFATIEDLKSVSGIGDKKFVDLQTKITV